MQLSTSNPQPASCCGGYCPQNSSVYVTLRNDGCDIASGTLTTGGAQYTISFAKPADLPTGETVQAVGWWSLGPTVQQFRQTLQGSWPFDGCQVLEATGAPPSDSCWYNGSPYGKFGVTGGWWLVGRYATPPLYFYSNYWIDDYVGMLPGTVDWYRQQGRAP